MTAERKPFRPNIRETPPASVSVHESVPTPAQGASTYTSSEAPARATPDALTPGNIAAASMAASLLTHIRRYALQFSICRASITRFH